MASVWTWLVLGICCIGALVVAVPLRLLTFPFDRRCAITGRFIRSIGVVVTYFNPLWKFEVYGELSDFRPSRTVVVCNHVSNSDAFFLAHLPWEMKWLGKSTLFRIPIFGWLMWLANDVAVRRGRRDSIVRAMDECKVHIERGMPVMIFPEGTRSSSGNLLPFKDGAFRLAIDSKANVLPLAVAGSREALEKGSWRFGRARGLVSMGAPIESDGKSVAQLRDEVRESVEHQYLALQRELAARPDGEVRP